MERIDLIKGIPLFDGLNAQELEEIADLFREFPRLKGETICREGEEGDSLYIVISGELEVRTGSEEDKRVINRMGPGDFFGEIPLLTGETRTATVTVVRDARLLSIDRHAFEAFIRKSAKMLEHLSKVMAQRLARVSRGEVVPRATTVVSVVGPPGIKGKSLTATALAGLLADFTHKQAIHVGFRLQEKGRKKPKSTPTLTSLAGRTQRTIQRHIKKTHESTAFLEIGAEEGLGQNEIRASLGRLLAAFHQTFSYVVFDASGEAKGLIPSIVASSDYVVRIEGPGPLDMEGALDGSVRVYSLINRFNKGSRTIPINHAEPFVLPIEPALDGLGPRCPGKLHPAPPTDICRKASSPTRQEDPRDKCRACPWGWRCFRDCPCGCAQGP